MKTIWKYKITTDEIIQIKIPKKSKFLTVSAQLGEVYMWCLVDTDNELEVINLKVYGTGHEIDGNEIRTYLGTFFVRSFVFHLFDIT